MTPLRNFSFHTLLVAAAFVCGSLAPLAGNATTAMSSLSGPAEVPPTTSSGTGSLAASITNNVVTYTISYKDLTGPVTGAHFHGPAAPGENAGVVVPFAPPLDSPITGTATLTAPQLADLLAGKWYVNLHTAANPNGEIRGQVLITP